MGLNVFSVRGTYCMGLSMDSLNATLGLPITQGQLYSLSILCRHTARSYDGCSLLKSCPLKIWGSKVRAQLVLVPLCVCVCVYLTVDLQVCVST